MSWALLVFAPLNVAAYLYTPCAFGLLALLRNEGSEVQAK
jgi:hypothetical protein